jgi:hypothetical protein
MVKLTVMAPTEAATKWSEEAPKRQVYYEKETIGKGSVMEANARAAASTYKAAVSAADIDKRFSGGLKGSGAKFDRKVKDVGVSRFGPGITAAKPDYETKVGPYLAEIAATDVPARKPRGDPGNWDRSRKIGEALNKKRLALAAAG